MLPPSNLNFRYMELEADITIRNHADSHECPREGCGLRQIHRSPSRRNPNRMVCIDSDCKLLHRCAWHAGQTCEQFETTRERDDEKMAEELASTEEVSSRTRNCPSCTMPIQKDEDCNHITCKWIHCEKSLAVLLTNWTA